MRYWTEVLFERLAALAEGDGVEARDERTPKPREAAGRRDDATGQRNDAAGRRENAAERRGNEAEPREITSGRRGDVLRTFEEIVEREWGPTGHARFQRLLPDSRYSCTAPFWI